VTLEEVILNRNMLGAWGHLHGGRRGNGAIIIFKHCGFDQRVCDPGELHGGDDF
jgi:hypothetical protein